MHISKWIFGLIAMMFGLLMGAPQTAHAQTTLVVDSTANTNDGSCSDGDCTIREAFQVIADDTSGETDFVIQLQQGETYTLNTVEDTDFGATGLATLSNTVNVQVDGNGGATIERDPAAPHFRLMTSQNGLLNLVDVTLRNGYADSSGQSSSSGGAVAITNGNFSAFNSVFENNTSPNFGGAIFALNSIDISVNNSHFEANSAQSGGAIYTEADVSIARSSFVSNSASSHGGAIRVRVTDPGFAAVDSYNTIYQSTFYDNTGISIISIYEIVGDFSAPQRDIYAALSHSTVVGNNILADPNDPTPVDAAVLGYGDSGGDPLYVTFDGNHNLIASNTTQDGTESNCRGISNGSASVVFSFYSNFVGTGGCCGTVVNTFINPADVFGTYIEDTPQPNRRNDALQSSVTFEQTSSALLADFDLYDTYDCQADLDKGGIVNDVIQGGPRYEGVFPYDADGDSNAICDIGAFEYTNYLGDAGAELNNGRWSGAASFYTSSLAKEQDTLFLINNDGSPKVMSQTVSQTLISGMSYNLTFYIAGRNVDTSGQAGIAVDFYPLLGSPSRQYCVFNLTQSTFNWQEVTCEMTTEFFVNYFTVSFGTRNIDDGQIGFDYIRFEPVNSAAPG